MTPNIEFHIPTEDGAELNENTTDPELVAQVAHAGKELREYLDRNPRDGVRFPETEDQYGTKTPAGRMILLVPLGSPIPRSGDDSLPTPLMTIFAYDDGTMLVTSHFKVGRQDTCSIQLLIDENDYMILTGNPIDYDFANPVRKPTSLRYVDEFGFARYVRLREPFLPTNNDMSEIDMPVLQRYYVDGITNLLLTLHANNTIDNITAQEALKAGRAVDGSTLQQEAYNTLVNAA